MTPLSTAQLQLVAAERAVALARDARARDEREQARAGRRSALSVARGRTGRVLIELGTLLAGRDSVEQQAERPASRRVVSAAR